MKDAQCYVCGCPRPVYVFEKESNSFYRCRDCGVVFIWPQKKAEAISEMYQHWGDRYYLDPKMIEYDYSCNFDERLARIKPYRVNNRLLDVGCSLGAFLSAARSEKWDCYGVELSRPTALYAKNERNLNVFNGSLSEAHYPDNHFDVVNIWAVLEHVTDPAGVLREAARVLRKGGLLIFCVPNYGSLPIKILDKKYRYICEGHLFYFTKNSVNLLLRMAGLKAVEVSSEHFSPLSFVEDMRGVKPNTLKTYSQERDKTQTLRKNKIAVSILRPCWKIFLFCVSKLFLGENLVVYAVK